MTKKITYFKTSTLTSSGYYLAGLDSIQNKFNFKLCHRSTIPERIKDGSTLFNSKTSNPNFSKSVRDRKPIPDFQHLFEVQNQNTRFLFCIDGSDSAYSLNTSQLKRVKYYFKVNYNKDILSTIKDDILIENMEKIHPINPLFPVRPKLSSLVLPPLDRDLKKTFSRFRKIIDIPDIDYLRKLRNIPKKWDVFFVLSYYNQAHHQDKNQYRYKLMKHLKSCDDINSFVGFVGKDIPDAYSEFHLKRLKLKDYCKKLAQSRIGIYVEGLHNCLSYKLPTMMALGLPIVGQNIKNNNKLMQNTFFKYQFSEDNPERIANKIRMLSKHPSLINDLGKQNANTFDKSLSPEMTMSQTLSFMKI